MIDDEDSSEGIVASTDDDCDELSKAVEHHIINQEAPSKRQDELYAYHRRPDIDDTGSHDNDPTNIWGNSRRPESCHNRFPFQEDYHHRRFDDEMRNLRDRPLSPHPLSRQHHYGAEEAAPSRMPLGPRRYLDATQPNTMRKSSSPPLYRRLIVEPVWRHDRFPLVTPRGVYSHENPPSNVKREYRGYAGRHHPSIRHAPEQFVPHYLSMDTDHRVRDTDHRSSNDAHGRFLQHNNKMTSRSNTYLGRDHRSRHIEASRLSDLINESLTHYGRKQEKLAPKPVSRNSEKSLHPLDRLAHLTKSTRGPSTERWLHDKYDDKISDAPQEPSSTSGVTAKNVSTSETREDATTSLGEEHKITSTKEDSSSSPHQSESPDGLIHAKKCGDSVTKKVGTTKEAESIEVVGANESSDDDEELLGLRLKALSSALAEEKKARNGLKKRSSRKKKLKNLIHRDYDTSQSEKMKSAHSVSAGSLFKRYSPRLPISVTSRSARSKLDPSRLTLLGEMVKNYRPTAALAKIKSKPDLRKSSQSSDDKKLDDQKLLDQEATLGKEVEKAESPKTENIHSAQNIGKTDLVDNYDEMEMDLEMEDGGSDSGLLPPGVEQPTPEELPPVSSSVNATQLLDVTRGAELVGNSTPSQESIWSMLEHGAHSDSHSNIEDNHEQLQIEGIQKRESRRLSSEDCVDEEALRQTLLRQLFKNTTKDGDSDQPPAVEAKPAPLPSQFPYKPPELKVVSDPISTIMSSLPSTSLVPVVTSSPTSCVQTFTAPSTPVISVKELQVTTPTISKTTCANDATPKTTLADTSITSLPTTNEMSDNTPLVFLPKTASTPAVSQTAPLQKAAKRKRRKAIADPVEVLFQIANVNSEKTAIPPKQKNNILKLAVTNIAAKSKQSISNPTASKTLVKTATTLIRSTAVRPTAKSASAMPLMQLPRHQPVVVNIGSSDEEDSLLSSNQPDSPRHETVQIQRDKVTEMIHQMRVLATAKQNVTSKTNNGNENLDAAKNSMSPNASNISPRVPTNNAIKKLKIRHNRISLLIKKDKIRLNRVKMTEMAKKDELKATEDELKQMLHRIAALRSKKARCDEVLQQCWKQETVITERMGKRNAQRKLIQQKVQNHLKHSKRNNASVENSTTQIVAAVADAATTSNSSSGNASKLDIEKQRLLAKQQKLAETISQMKKTETTHPVARKRSSLSNEVQSHLAKYRKTRTPSNPTAHDLSLNKIVISVPSPAKQSSPTLAAKSSEEVGKATESESPKSTESGLPRNEDCDSVEETSISDLTMKLRKIVTNNITNYQPFASYNPVLSYEAEPFAAKFWEQTTPVPIQKWKLNGREIPLPTLVPPQETHAILPIDTNYESPLRLFRSYRLNPFLRMKEKLSIKSATFSHKMNPRKIMCRYELSGKCQDPNCKAQHADQYQLSSDELIADLLLYSPSLLGKNMASVVSNDALIEKSRAACEKFLGVSKAQEHMSVDDKCILIASRVNSTLGNKAPYTTVLKPRSVRLNQHVKESPVLPITMQKEKVEVATDHQDNSADEPDSGVERNERYFEENTQQDIEKLEAAVKKDPKNTQLWLKLTDKQMKAKDSNRMELALHTLCLALEENSFSGEIWTYYLNLLHARKGGQCSEDLDEMVSQAIELVPLSTQIWDLLLSWKSNIAKMEILLDQLIANIVKFVEDTEGSHEEHNPEFLSKWLLETVLRKVQLLLYRGDLDDALDQLSHMIESFVQQRVWAITNSGRHCLLPNDFCILKLCFINIKHFKRLPRCFMPDIRPLDSTGMVHALKIHKTSDVQLHFSSNSKCSDKFSSLLDDLNASIEECKIGAEVDLACFPLLWEKLRLLKAQEQWAEARSLCRLIYEKVQQSLVAENLRFGFSVNKLIRILNDCIIFSADCVAKLGSTHDAIQVFENAINDSKTLDPKLCFEAALLQNRVDSEDVEAVLVYLESCISSFVKSESDCLDANSLKLMLKHLLQLPFPMKQKIPEFMEGVSWATVQKAKPFLWLMYSLLLQITGASNEVVGLCYEQGILDVADVNDKQELWLRYIRYKQTLALSLSEAGKAKQQQWLRNLSFLVKRCLTTMSPILSSEDVESGVCHYSDYAFHNQVSTVYLSCFSTRQQMASAFNFLVEIMPYNSLLILRACKFHLSHGDHRSVISTVWKITNNTKCQNETLWKISISSHFLTGRIAKAVRLAKQAVECVPFSSQLWSDYLTLLKAYGLPAEFIEEKVRCSNVLQVDASRLVKDS